MNCSRPGPVQARGKPLPFEPCRPPQHCRHALAPPGAIAPPFGSAPRWPPPSGCSTASSATGTAAARGRRGPAAGLGPAAPRPRAARWPGSTPPRSAKGCRPRACCSSCAACVPDCQLVYTHFSPSAEALAAPPRGGRGRLPALRSARRPPTGCCRAGSPICSCSPSSTSGRSSPPGPPPAGAEVAHRRRHREPGQRPAPLAGPALLAARVRGRGRRRRDLRRRRRPARPAGRAAPSGSGCWATPASTAWPSGSRRCRPTTRCSASDGERPPWWPAPPGRRTRPCCSRAFAECRARRPEARLILVPHEPTAEHLAGLERRAADGTARRPCASARPTARRRCCWSTGSGCSRRSTAPGTMAYVGGGFGRAGLHSVLEPAAWGVPVVFGPRWRNSRDAALLLRGRRAALGAAAAAPSGPRRALESSGRTGSRTSAHGRRRAGGRGKWWSAEWVRRSGARACWPSLFRHDPFEGHRAGHDQAAVRAVISTSLQRLRTLILRSATPLPPASWAASAFRSDGP